MHQLRDEDIGSGMVGRGFTNGDRYMKRGEILTREQILKMPRANRMALVDKGMLLVYPWIMRLSHRRGRLKASASSWDSDQGLEGLLRGTPCPSGKNYR